MRIVTWNVNSIRVRQQHVQSLVEKESPHVLCLQEIKTEEKTYPEFDFESTSSVNGQKSYNGVSVHTWKNEHSDVEINPLFSCKDSRVIAFTYKSIRFINAYIPSGGGSEIAYFNKIMWLKEFTLYLSFQREKYKNIVVLGDFNICPSHNDVWNENKWSKVCSNLTCTELERQAFSDIISLGFVDAVELHLCTKEYTWWNYMGNSFKKNEGLRIDHILVSANLAKYVKNATILKDYRGMERPSDHAPVMVEISKR